MKFILGYLDLGEHYDKPDKLVVFKSESEADFEAEEWVTVEAESETEARYKYRASFDEWQNKTQR